MAALCGIIEMREREREKEKVYVREKEGFGSLKMGRGLLFPNSHLLFLSSWFRMA
jgi:hypothetical protein